MCDRRRCELERLEVARAASAATLARRDRLSGTADRGDPAVLRGEFEGPLGERTALR